MGGGLTTPVPVTDDLILAARETPQSMPSLLGNATLRSRTGTLEVFPALRTSVLDESATGGSDLPEAPAGLAEVDTAERDGSASLASVQEPLPVFVQYEVQPGDTVSQIAERFGIAADYILWNNVDVIDDVNSLSIGATLQVPSVEGIIHSARLGETVSGIAVEYDATTEAIVEFEANGFDGDADNLPIGALILVPGGRRVPPPPEADPPPWTAPDPSGPAVDPAPPAWRPPPPPAAATWVWPATGRLTNLFTPRHPLGIDISMVVGTPLGAAAAGQVVFVGGSPCCSYGYHVIIEHADGYETLYAHLSDVYVSNGQRVSAGEVIGGSGNTGYSTGPHLHFEVREGGVYRNPLGYLPSGS